MGLLQARNPAKRLSFSLGRSPVLKQTKGEWFEDSDDNGLPDGYEAMMKVDRDRDGRPDATQEMEKRLLAEVRTMILLYLLVGLTLLAGFAIVERLFLR